MVISNGNETLSLDSHYPPGCGVLLVLVPGGCNLLDVAPSVLGPRLGPPGSSGSAAKAGGRHTWLDMPHKVTIVNSARVDIY